MEDFRKFLSARLSRQQTEADTHPAPDLLAAFAESRLRNSERKQVLTHLAVCGGVPGRAGVYGGRSRFASGREADNRPLVESALGQRVRGRVRRGCGDLAFKLPGASGSAAAGNPGAASDGTRENQKLLNPRYLRPHSPRRKRPRAVTPQAAVSIAQLPAPPLPSEDEIAKAGQAMTPPTEHLEFGPSKAFETAPTASISGTDNGIAGSGRRP